MYCEWPQGRFLWAGKTVKRMKIQLNTFSKAILWAELESLLE